MIDETPLPQSSDSDGALQQEPRAGMPAMTFRLLVTALIVLLVAVGLASYFVVREVKRSQAPTTMASAQVAELQTQIEENPDDPMLYLRLADVYYSVGDYESARSAIDEVTARESTGTIAAQAIYGLARIHEAQGETETAIATYQESLDLEVLPDSVYDLGRLYLIEEMTDKGIEQWELYLELVPTEGGVMRNLAKVYEDQGDKEKALALYKRASGFIPDDQQVKQAITRLSSSE